MDREDVWVGTTGDQLLQHLAAVMLRIAHLAVELAIGERASTPLAELGIRLGSNRKRPCQNPKVCCVRCFTGWPRSSSRGRRPIWARSSAAK